MQNPILFQARRILQIFENLDSNQLRVLIASELLDDLARCAAEASPSKVDRDQYQDILDIRKTLFRVTLGGQANTDQIVTGLGFAFHRSINQENFPLNSNGSQREDQIEIIDPRGEFSTDEGLQRLHDSNLGQPTYEHALRFAAQHGCTIKAESKPFIVFLHDACESQNRGDVMYLDCSREYRKLNLRRSDQNFSQDCMLAGVRR